MSVVKRNLNWYSTASDVVKQLNVRADGKVVIVTGANTGIGIETARTFADIGAHVILGCRSIEKGNAALEDIKKTTKSTKVEVQELDLTSLKSVRDFSARFISTGKPLHYLILNAGIMACPYTTTKEGFEIQLGTNHLGHFLLANLLIEPLKAGAPSRVIVVSSEGHRIARSGIYLQDFEHYGANGSYSKWWAYGRSKLANVMFAKEFSKRFQKFGIIAHSLHPGAIRTELGRHQFGAGFFGIILANPIYPLMKTPPQGAATSVFAALAPEQTEGGKYFSDCHEASVNAKALDEEDQRLLWEKSANLVGLD